mmetsp:Transcript_10470/g.27460  ORF Transcript_10470/g.27460 Transcript_10470/m.27460 type:complete len:121 (+) Transcript_10470:161-523(+)
MPDMASKHRHFFVDFTNPRRLWAVTVSTGTHTGDLVLPMKTIPATGKKYESAPEVQSYRFDEAGRCTALTAGYVADRDMGNMGGLGALDDEEEGRPGGFGRGSGGRHGAERRDRHAEEVK